MDITLSLYFLLLLGFIILISLGLNFFFLILFTRKKEKQINFEEAFSILNSSIDVQKGKFLLGLLSLAKKYGVLSSDGRVNPPTDAVQQYAKDKQELKTAIVKKIVRCLSLKVRETILLYYSESGMVDYIISELDKYYETNKDEPLINGGSND